MKNKTKSEFERFDTTMKTILSTSYKELQQKLAEEKKRKRGKQKAN